MKRLTAVCCALALFAMAGMLQFARGASSEFDAKKAFSEAPFYVYPQAGEVADLDVLKTIVDTRVEEGDNPRILMGSSELDLVEPNSSHPTIFFGEHNYGFDTVSVGKAGYQSLWQAMEIGALDQVDAVPDDKVALIVGMQWFMGDGCTTEAFLNSFSEDAYRACMENPRISQETKDAITARSVELGKQRSDLERLSSDFLPDRIDEMVFGVIDGAENKAELEAAVSDNTPIPVGRFGDPSDPDWDALMELSIAEGEEACTTNDIGVYDEYYEEYFIPWIEEADSEPKPESFTEWSQKELGDFKLYLQVCRETGIEPLIVIMPVKAAYYDHTEYDYESRQLYYEMIRSACDEFGVEYVDCSGYEYDTYYMRDVMHFGWTGWVHVDQALYEFFGGGK